jgi:hypothetical protein
VVVGGIMGEGVGQEGGWAITLARWARGRAW